MKLLSLNTTKLWKMSNKNSVSITLLFYWYTIFWYVWDVFWDRLKMIKTTQIKRVVV